MSSKGRTVTDQEISERHRQHFTRYVDGNINMPCRPGKRSSRPDGFMLAELALEHPQSLHDALSAMPFKANLDFYLR